MVERRKDLRMSNILPVKISQTDGDIVTETINISRSGAYCRIKKYIEPMTKLKINLLMPNRKNGKNVPKKISCEGVGVRVEPIPGESAYNVAIFFSDISKRDSEFISEYLQSHLE